MDSSVEVSSINDTLFWGRHFWAIGHGVWSTVNITDEIVQEYLEHGRNPSNKEDGNMIIK